MCVGRLRIDEFSEIRPALASPVTAHANTKSNTLLFTVPSPDSTAPSNGATSFLNYQKIRARFSITCGQQRRQKTTSNNWRNSGWRAQPTISENADALLSAVTIEGDA
jgi:hypothetical protein